MKAWLPLIRRSVDEVRRVCDAWLAENMEMQPKAIPRGMTGGRFHGTKIVTITQAPKAETYRDDRIRAALAYEEQYWRGQFRSPSPRMRLHVYTAVKIIEASAAIDTSGLLVSAACIV